MAMHAWPVFMSRQWLCMHGLCLCQECGERASPGCCCSRVQYPFWWNVVLECCLPSRAERSQASCWQLWHPHWVQCWLAGRGVPCRMLGTAARPPEGSLCDASLALCATLVLRACTMQALPSLVHCIPALVTADQPLGCGGQFCTPAPTFMCTPCG